MKRGECQVIEITDFMSGIHQERMDQVLKAVIHYYVETVQPVSSHALVRKYHLPWSTATLRHIMSELEEVGFLYQPHTSAGRIPTEDGFRYYVDRLMDRRHITDQERNIFLQGYHNRDENIEALFNTTSRLLSLACEYPAVVLLPRADHLVLKHVEFVRLKAGEALAILIFNSGLTKTRLLLTEDDFSSADLLRVNNYLNEIAEGFTLFQVRARIRAEMEKERILCDRLFSKFLSLSMETFLEETVKKSFVISGQELFLKEPEFADAHHFRNILSILEEKSQIIGLLDHVMQGSGVKVFIGDKNSGLKDLTLVSAPYGSKGCLLGTLGVLGHTRMAYDRVIPLVEYTAQLLGTHISH